MEDQLLGAMIHPVGGDVAQSLQYLYDSAGNRLSEQLETAGASYAVTSYQYNEVNQLTAHGGPGNVNVRFRGTVDEPATVKMEINDSGTWVDAKMSQDYESQSNGKFFSKELTLPLGANTVDVQATDRSTTPNTRTQRYSLLVTGTGLRDYSYDLNGNCEGYTSASGNRVYEWDAENRLVTIQTTLPGAPETVLRTEIAYDGLSRRVRMTERTNSEPGVSRTFVWCGRQLCEERDAGGAAVTKRFYPEGEQIDGTAYYFNKDHLGSVWELVWPGGVARERYDYDPYGRRTVILAGSQSADFGFTGHYYHKPSGLHFAVYRAYDAEIGRWLNRDPIGEEGGINLYGFVRNDPINGVDPFGLWNLFAPWTWGVPTGAGTTIWNSLNPLDSSAGWGGFSWDTTLQADAAFWDGVIPFWNPYSDLYDPCDKSLKWSKRIGELTRDAELTLAIPNIGTWAKNPVLYEIGQKTRLAGDVAKYANLGAIERGRALVSELGWARAILPEGAGWRLGLGETFSTLPTPGGWLGIIGAGEAVDNTWFW